MGIIFNFPYCPAKIDFILKNPWHFPFFRADIRMPGVYHSLAKHEAALWAFHLTFG